MTRISAAVTPFFGVLNALSFDRIELMESPLLWLERSSSCASGGE